MPPATATPQERFRYLPALFGSGVSWLGAAVAAGGAAPDHKLLAASAVFISGAGAALLNEFHKSFNDLQRAHRNHLIRRGMAMALRDALLSAQERFGEEIPPELRKDFFVHWPEILRQCQDDDDMVEVLLPLADSEKQWSALNRYYDELKDVESAKDSTDKAVRLERRESDDRWALAELLRRFPCPDSENQILHLDKWSEKESLVFATKLLPLYRVAFATLFSEGGEISAAIEYKNVKFTRQQLEEIQLKLESGFECLSSQVAAIDEHVSGLGTQIDELKRMFAALIEQQTARGELPVGAITAQNKEAKIEANIRELPKVLEEIKQSQSPVATATVELLLAAGKLDEAARVGQAQFESAQESYAEQGRNFARACYDLGRINELSFRWGAALENYRQAWELSQHTNPDYGFKYAHFASDLNHHQDAIAAYRAVLPLCGSPNDTAVIFNALGVVYNDAGLHAQAETAYISALTQIKYLYEQSPGTYAPTVAMVLNNVGMLYRRTERNLQAAKAYRDALDLYRSLAAAHQLFEPYVATTLNNLGVLYSDSQLYDEAEAAHKEALAIYRKLTDNQPSAYEGDLAMALHNLGIIYLAIHRPEEAERHFEEALPIRRRLAERHPAAYKPELAKTLLNLSIHYLALARTETAERDSFEAEQIFILWSQTNSTRSDDLLAKILATRSMVRKAVGDGHAALDYARRSLDAATKSELKVAMQLLIAELTA